MTPEVTLLATCAGSCDEPLLFSTASESREHGRRRVCWDQERRVLIFRAPSLVTVVNMQPQFRLGLFPGGRRSAFRAEPASREADVFAARGTGRVMTPAVLVPGHMRVTFRDAGGWERVRWFGATN